MIDFLFFLLYTLYHQRQEKIFLVDNIYGMKPKRKEYCRKKKGSKVSVVTRDEIDSKDLTGIEGDSEGVQIVEDETVDSAWESIEGNLDVTTIVKQMNVLKLITYYLLAENQKKNSTNLISLL